MTLRELVDKVHQVCGHDVAETARITQMLNEAQDEISKLTTAPTKEIRKTVTGAFELEEAEYNGILEVHATYEGLQRGRRIRLLTTTEASRYFPDWRGRLHGNSGNAHGIIQYLIYDPVNVTAPLVPMPGGFPATELFVKLHIRPNRLVEWDDVPLNGELPNSHEALWQYVAFQLFNEGGDERRWQRGMMAFSRYKELVDRMVSDARPEPVFVERETAGWPENGWRGGSW